MILQKGVKYFEILFEIVMTSMREEKKRNADRHVEKFRHESERGKLS